MNQFQVQRGGDLEADHKALETAPVPTHSALPSGEVQVFRPQLPPVDRLLPYLQSIDRTRVYSNHGPLVEEFQARLAALLHLPSDGVASAASGHDALVGAILGHAGRATAERPYALVPAFTFCATALAVEQCGYVPWLVDVDPDSWQLLPRMLDRHHLLAKVGLVVPVAAYGTTPRTPEWETFESATGIPVVIDAAASFAALAAGDAQVGRTPVVLSFHATKCFSTAEGGAVLSQDARLVSAIAASLNFGFAGDRDCSRASINGKMSEYHAAMGLASLDMWPSTLCRWREVAASYRQEADASGIGDRILAMPAVGANHAFYRDDAVAVAGVVERLSMAGIDTRFWYGGGLHRHSHFRHSGADDLQATQRLCTRMVGLPMAPDLSRQVVARIIGIVADGPGKHATAPGNDER